MLGIDPEFGSSALRVWVAAGSAALLFLLCVLAILQSQLRAAANPVARAGAVACAAVLGAAMAWTLLSHSPATDRSADRRSFEARAQELTARTLAPGSPLACLDALAGESVETACEKALFATPANVAAASAYVAARLTLLTNMTAYAAHGGTDMDDLLLPLRRALEADHFGFVAHTLAVRDGCTSQNCKSLAPLHDASHVRDNLSAQTFDHYLEHYAPIWSATPDAPSADGTQPQGTTASLQVNAPHKPVNIDFPTAASIPAVSIMNPEPTGPVLPGVAAAAAANPNSQAGAASAHHNRKQANGTTSNLVQSAPSVSGSAEPIWPEPVPLPPQQPQPALQQNPPLATAAPIQLSPPATASAVAPARAQ